MPLPNIPSYNHLDNINSPQSNFPPNPNQNLNFQSQEKNFLRGPKDVSSLPEWERAERLKKQMLQQDTQDSLLKQIAEKQEEKKRKIQEAKMEDEKDQAKLAVERALLIEKNAHEREDARIKGVHLNLISGREPNGKCYSCRKG